MNLIEFNSETFICIDKVLCIVTMNDDSSALVKWDNGDGEIIKNVNIPFILDTINGTEEFYIAENGTDGALIVRIAAVAKICTMIVVDDSELDDPEDMKVVIIQIGDEEFNIPNTNLKDALLKYNMAYQQWFGD